MTHDDPVRPDLDAAIDAVVPALTAIGDDVAATSQRRVLSSLREGPAPLDGTGAWRWQVASAGLVAAAGVAALVFWPSMGPVDAPAQALLPSRPVAAVVAEVPAVAGPMRVAAPPASLAMEVSGRARGPRGPMSSARPDPLIALVHAVTAIPVDTWNRGTAIAAAGELTIPDVPLAPLVVAPVEIPPITDAPSVAASPGEPR